MAGSHEVRGSIPLRSTKLSGLGISQPFFVALARRRPFFAAKRHDADCRRREAFDPQPDCRRCEPAAPIMRARRGRRCPPLPSTTNPRRFREIKCPPISRNRRGCASGLQRVRREGHAHSPGGVHSFLHMPHLFSRKGGNARLGYNCREEPGRFWQQAFWQRTL